MDAPESHAAIVRDPTTCDMEYCFDAREIQKAAGAFFVGEAIEYMYNEEKSVSAAFAKGGKLLEDEPSKEREAVHGTTNQTRENCDVTTIAPTTATNKKKTETTSNGTRAPVDKFLRGGVSKTTKKTPKSPWIITGRGLQKQKKHSTKLSTAE
jgi:hypothetical protein